MKITCGTDIIEIERVKESIENVGTKFIERVYTEKEIEYCESRKKQKYQSNYWTNLRHACDGWE